MPSAVRRVDVAGRDVTEYLQLLLRKAGYHLHTSAEKEIVRLTKEKVCYVALNPSKEEKEISNRIEELKLPDGNAVRVSVYVSDDQVNLRLIHHVALCSSVPNGLGHPRFCSIQTSSASNIRAYIKSLWTLSIRRIWIFARGFSPTSF